MRYGKKIRSKHNKTKNSYMISLASPNICTGCSACAFVCAKNAITMTPNSIGIVLPTVDKSKCVNCGRCQSVCPALNPVDKHYPIKVYAAWHNDTNERTQSASGAIAAAAYKHAIEEGMNIAGTIQKDDFSVCLILSDDVSDIELFRNSKYVYSSIESLLPELKKSINEGKRSLVIALPCQIAAIKKCFPKQDLLLYVDIVCHGTTPTSYLQQHIRNIESKCGKRAVKMYFRDPSLYTHTYHFSLYDNKGTRFYAQRTMNGDTYQIGYHRVVSYRDNCYNCQYAQAKRVGDFTLCDYSGLGAIAPFEYNHINTSCVLVNTQRGYDFFRTLIGKRVVNAVERPLKEPIAGNRQLQRPCDKNAMRKDFEKQIVKYNGDFEKAMSVVIKKSKRRYKYRMLFGFPIRVLKGTRHYL